MGTVNKKVSETGRSHGLAEFARLFRSMIDPYRPEQHYMRGPGPNWRPAAAPLRPRPVSRLLGRISARPDPTPTSFPPKAARRATR